jgi:protein ImuB
MEREPMKQQETYAAVLIREFPMQSLLRLRPELASKACVVMEGEPPLEQLCSLNAKAHALGAVIGMTRVEIDTFPNLTALSRSFAEEASSKAALLECAGIFSPRIEDQSTPNAFLWVIDITGTEKLFGTPLILASQLQKQIQALHFACSIAISANFNAAVAMVRNACPRDPIAIIPAGEESEQLSPLPLTVLDLSEDNAETLSLWGIHTLGMLAALPEKALIARIGQQGKHLRQLALGRHPHHFKPVEAEFALAERMEFETPIELLDSLLFAIGIMLEQLIHRAAAHILSLASVTITLHLDSAASHTRTVRPAQPTNDRGLWLKLLHLDLQAHPPNASILAMDVNAQPGIAGKVQLGLFSPQSPEPMHMDVTLARIRSIVGQDAVGLGTLEDTHRPDAFSMRPFTVAPTSAVKSTPHTQHSATRRLRPPEPILVSLHATRPVCFYFNEKRYTVELAYGPWLSSGEWWCPTLWSNAQWDIVARAEDGSLLCCCVMHDTVQSCWQMAALYD